jgi:hypothetical protein
MREPWVRSVRVSVLAALLLLPAGALAQDASFTSSFRLEECGFRSVGRNPYMLLRPGRQLVLEGEDDGELVRVVITVLPKIRRVTLDIGGRSRTVVTRIVEEREWKDGELVEVSRNFFAVCARTDDVIYFGEEVDIYEDGEIVSHDGAWLAGQDGAMPGIIMPGTFLLGSRYFQEVAPGVALDRAEHVRMGFSATTPFGTLDDCVEVLETTPLEPGAESRKVYCAGIGLVMDDGVQLVAVFDHAGAHDEDGGDGD